MKRYIPLIIILCLTSLPIIHGETMTKDGLRIEVTLGKSEFGDILEFTVTAENLTNSEKTLLGTISLDPKKYADMDEESRTTPIYLEILPKEKVKDIFYLIAAYEVSAPQWNFTIDSIYDFIIDEDFTADDYPEITDDNTEDVSDEIEKDLEENMRNNDISITGYWKMEKTEDSKIYGNWSWVFKENGTVVIEEILGAEARMPMEYQGSYEIKGNKVHLTIFSASPFPAILTIRGDNLVAEGLILIKTGDDMSIF